MPEKSPKVSVLTPIYHTTPTHLREMIESILNQTFTDFEFLILNDSPDNTELDAIVKSYKDKRIKYFKNDRNMGISASRNKLLEMARGEYLAIFDHDDISVPTRLEKEVAVLDTNPYIGVVSSWVQYFGERNKIRIYPEYDTDIKMWMTDNCAIAHSASMIRKSVLVENKIYYEDYYFPSEDYRLFARLMDVTHFYNIQEVLLKYRCFLQNTTHVQAIRMSQKHNEIKLSIVNKFFAYYVAYKKHVSKRTIFRCSLFGVVPLFKIKSRWVYLFGCIPVFKIKWG